MNKIIEYNVAELLKVLEEKNLKDGILKEPIRNYLELANSNEKIEIIKRVLTELSDENLTTVEMATILGVKEHEKGPIKGIMFEMDYIKKTKEKVNSKGIKIKITGETEKNVRKNIGLVRECEKKGMIKENTNLCVTTKIGEEEISSDEYIKLVYGILKKINEVPCVLMFTLVGSAYTKSILEKENVEDIAVKMIRRKKEQNNLVAMNNSIVYGNFASVANSTRRI